MVSAEAWARSQRRPATKTLVEEPDQAAGELAVVHPEKTIESVETHEFPEVDPVSGEEPATAKEPAVVPEELVVGPDQPQVATEEPEEEDTSDGVQASKQVAPVPQDAPVVTGVPGPG